MNGDSARASGAGVPVLTLFHNGADLVGPFFESLAAMPTPFSLFLLDNGSTDGTGDALAERLPGFPYSVRFFRSHRNHGFAEGINLLSEQVEGDFFFILNSDARPRPDCFDRLLERMRVDSRVALAEARQFPEPHPKAFDPRTGETTWCSGALTLIRKSAFDSVGRFDTAFFMYCEDIDLSWRLWIAGWKCIYDPDAVVDHVAGHARREKNPVRRTRENYLSFRNSLFLYHRFRGPRDRGVLRSFLLKRFVSRRYPLTSKALFLIAFIDHIRYIPYLKMSRSAWGGREHPWIRFGETSLAE